MMKLQLQELTLLASAKIRPGVNKQDLSSATCAILGNSVNPAMIWELIEKLVIMKLLYKPTNYAYIITPEGSKLLLEDYQNLQIVMLKLHSAIIG
jgi:predicted transcriptional regulator